MLLLLLSLLPPPVGRGARRSYPPACSPLPGPSSSRLLSPGRREKRLDPSGSSHAGPSRSPSTEREQGGKRSLSPSFPSWYRSRSSSGERRERGSRYCQCSRERRDRSCSPFRKHSEQRSRSRSRDFYSERSHDHRDSREYRPRDSPKRSLYRSRSRERAYRSRTPSERGDHAERYGKGATSLLGKKKKQSDVSAVRQMLQSVMSGFQKSLEAFGDNASNSSSAGASSRGTPSPRGSGQRRVCPRHVRVERLAPALALLPFMKSVRVRRGRAALRVNQTAPLVIVASHLPEREGAAVSHLSFLFRGVKTSRSTLLTRSRTRRVVGARCSPRIYQLL